LYELSVAFVGYTGKLSAIYRKKTAQKTDERVRLMDEIISGVQVIKMYAWEKPFTKLIKFARKAELKIVTKSSYVRGLYMTFNLFTTRVALFCTLLTMALTDQEITAAKVCDKLVQRINVNNNRTLNFRYSFLCRITTFCPRRCRVYSLGVYLK
jgi:hypothetical protein